MIKIEKRKIYGLIIGIIIFLIMALGLTYAYFYWASDAEDDTSVKLSVNKDIKGFINYNAGDAILTTGSTSFMPTDDYKNGLKTDIEFWRDPNTPMPIYGQLSLEILNLLNKDGGTETNIAKTYTMKWELTSKSSTAANAEETHIASGDFYGKRIGDKIVLTENFLLNTTATYYTFYIWLDQTKVNGFFPLDGELLTAEISASATTENYHYGASPIQTLTNLGLNSHLKNEKLDFSTVSTDADTGIYASLDDFGVSYYFRGNFTNNFVKFGKTKVGGYDMMWRIIRINGDGTVRLIYYGNTNNTARQVGNSTYKSSPFNNNAYIGYMSGNTGGSTFDTVHTNATASDVKTFLDNWYTTNILTTGYDGYIADAIYCNDRSTYTGTGVGTTETQYAAYGRLVINKNPTLQCVNENDRFTTSTVTGNGKLDYPIGLITADEIVFAGGMYDTQNTNYYLRPSGVNFTMTPFEFDGTKPYIFVMPANGSLSKYSVEQSTTIRPVITLRADAIKSGSGLETNPFIVTE